MWYDTHVYADKETQRAYQNAWMQQRRQDWLNERGPCVDCGSLNNLEVDHVDPTKKVTHRVWSWSEERRLAELEKCVPRCQSCHKSKTADFRKAQVQHGSYVMRYRHHCDCTECKGYAQKQKAAWRERNRLVLVSG